MFKVDSVVAIYDTHDQAEQAVKELQEAGVDMKSLSIAARNMHGQEQVVGYYTLGDRMMHWGKLGAFWGGLWGLLFDSALFSIPGIGPILLAGPLVSWMLAVLEGAVVFGGMSALGAALISVGIPKHSVIQYEAALKADKFLLILHDRPDAVAIAKDILPGTYHSSCTLHDEVIACEFPLSLASAKYPLRSAGDGTTRRNPTHVHRRMLSEHICLI